MSFASAQKKTRSNFINQKIFTDLTKIIVWMRKVMINYMSRLMEFKETDFLI